MRDECTSPPLKNYYAQDSHSRGDEVRMKPAKPVPHGLERRRRRIRKLLAGCRNSFRDVFARVDSALGLDDQGNNPDWG